jgi:hypothetical protein
MITREGSSITKTDKHRHKYADAMSEYLANRDDAYDNASGGAESPMGWFARFGKRLLRGDDRGFVWCEVYPSADDAENVFRALDDAHETWENMCDEGDPLPQSMSAWCAYVIACATEGLESYNLGEWEMLGRPSGPLG